MMELLIDRSLLTIDGEVVEAFGASSLSNGRIHVAILERVEVSEEKRGGAHIKFFTIWGGCLIRVDFSAEARPHVDHFVAEVRKVLASRGR